MVEILNTKLLTLTLTVYFLGASANAAGTVCIAAVEFNRCGIALLREIFSTKEAVAANLGRLLYCVVLHCCFSFFAVACFFSLLLK